MFITRFLANVTPYAHHSHHALDVGRRCPERRELQSSKTSASLCARRYPRARRARPERMVLKRIFSKNAVRADASDERPRKRRRGLRLPKRARTDVRAPGRKFTIVTTAALPWMTGTSVNPLLRAIYLAHGDETREVTLLVPWLALHDQAIVFPKRATFATPEAQTKYVMDWARARVGFEPRIKITWYPGRYATDKGSIVPVGDITTRVPKQDRDVAILEEPEHLCWYHPGARWTSRFKHVVGIIHTNYLEYARREEDGERKESILRWINHLTTRCHTHKVIKLSDAVQDFARSITSNVHGVSNRFIDAGKAKSKEIKRSGSGAFTRGAYFIGKCVWAKGYSELMHVVGDFNEQYAKKGERLEMDVYGDGDDFKEVQTEFARKNLPLNLLGCLDHADAKILDYKIFINPSLSDVVATTSAEALAMGKFVVCAEHPSNAFFATFPNCRTYSNMDEFAKVIREVTASVPKPMTEAEIHRLTWDAATERLLDAAAPCDETKHTIQSHFSDWFAARFHNAVTCSEALRCLIGGGAGTLVPPDDLANWSPDSWGGGLMDRKPSTADFGGAAR